METTTIQSEVEDQIRDLAQEVLGDADGTTQELLRRIRSHIQRQNNQIRRLRKVENLAAGVADQLKEVVTTTDESRLDALMDNLDS